MTKRQIGGLDLVRFAAALVVAVFHLGFWTWGFPRGGAGKVAGHVPEMTVLEPFRHFGWVGVEIFFVISGFVIAFSAAGSGVGRFVRHRLLRLIPAVLILAPLSAAALLWAGTNKPIIVMLELVRSLLFVPYGPWVDAVYWTLGVELAFYACVGVLLLCRRFERLIESFATLIGSTGLAFWVLHWLHPMPALAGNRTLDLLLVHHGSLFAVGVLLWAAWQRGVTRLRVFLIGAFTVGGVLQIAARAFKIAAQTGDAALWWPAPLAWLVALAAIVVSLRFSFGGRLTRQIGLSTYPLYLVHQIVGAVPLGVLIRAGVNPYAAFALVLVGTVAFSWFVAVHIEPYVRAALAGAIATVVSLFRDMRRTKPDTTR